MKIIARLLAAGLLATAGYATAALAQEPIKIGFISTFSGPQGVLGRELLDGFKLGLETSGGKLGGRPVDILQADDQGKPDSGRQAADKLIERDHVQIITGINFSNVLLAVAKPVLDAGVILFSINAGPSQYAGALCNPNYYNVSFQNDTPSEAMGIYLTQKGVKKVYLMAPNYPAGRDFLAGFKRTFKGEVAGEVYTTFGQLDYAAEIAQVRAAKPDAVFFFYPGGMGINFVKQYAQAGLKTEIPLYGPPFSLDQTVLPAMGDAAVGAYASTYWSESFDNTASKKFVADFEAAYHRIPSPSAAQAYDGARLLNAALTSIGGKIEDKAAFRKAMETVTFDSVRPGFRLNTNHHPIQDFYLTQIEKDDKGRPIMAMREVIVKQHPDSFVDKCKMPL